MRVSLVGGGEATDDAIAKAERIGEVIAERGHTLICGGRWGVMEAGCRGAKAQGGHTIGILPGIDPTAGNAFLDVPIATGIGDARNVLVVLNGDGVVAIDGRYGTLSEIAHALNIGRPVAGLDTHDVEGVEDVATPDEAIAYLEQVVDDT